MLRATTFIAAVLVACAPEPAGFSSKQDDIVNGWKSTEDKGVVAVLTPGMCSGTLVSKRVSRFTRSSTGR